MRISDWSSDVCSSDLALLHQLHFARKSPLLLIGVLAAAGRGFMVVQLGERRPDVAIAGRPQSHAEVDIVERNLQPFIESTNLVIDLTTHKQASTRDCR